MAVNMTIEKATEIYNSMLPSAVHGSDYTPEDLRKARLRILQDVYEFLEDENYHVGVMVLEDLTGIDYE